MGNVLRAIVQASHMRGMIGAKGNHSTYKVGPYHLSVGLIIAL